MAAATQPVDQPVHPWLVDINRRLWQTMPPKNMPAPAEQTEAPQPVRRMDGVSARLYYRLCRWWDDQPHTVTYRRDWSILDLMHHGICAESFRRTKGVGKTTLTELENLLTSAGYTLP